MKIVILDSKTFGKDISLDKFKQFGQIEMYETTKADETFNRVQDADVVITNKVVIDKNIMKNSKIKLICIAATGKNNVDLEYAKEKSIEVKNVTGYSIGTVPQLTITLVLHFVQKLDYYKKYVDDKKWEKSDIFTHLDVPFYELRNKNWGIIGLGSIGSKVAEIATAFGCNVTYYSTSGKSRSTKYTQQSLEELLSASDVITIHSPLNESTLNLINKTNLSTMKDGAVLVNVGRGGIINEKDLADSLDSDKVLYCGLDVVNIEPIEKDNPLNKIQNKERLVITPHIAWASIEARNTIIDRTFDNIQEFIL